MSKFYAGGGTTKFIDRLTGALGIHSSNVKVVSVYEGSLIVNFELNVDDQNDTDALSALQTQSDDMIKTLISSGASDLGAPVLDFDTSVSLQDDGTYTPVNIVAPSFYDQNNTAEANEFDTTVKIITEKNVTFQQNTVKVQIESQDSIRTETINIDSPIPESKVVTIKGEKDNKAIIIVAIALSTLALAVVFVCARKIYLKRDTE